ncbi:hypothetical protein GCM10010293_29130 [Streptomyces griseoflavus]|nr:hypothetical protein GCM10010293_29130 [Streptomyces griseoflavus]
MDVPCRLALADLPDELASFRTAHKRLLRRAMDGTGERILDVLAAAGR